MTSESILYNDEIRKKELVEQLSKILDQQLTATEVLDSKAWELLKITSATFGLVSAVEITLTKGQVSAGFWLTLAFVLFCYIVQSILVILVIRPRKWKLVPGVPRGPLLFETFLPNYLAEYDEVKQQYVPMNENGYLDQLLTDYLGRKNPDKPKEIELGAIAVAQGHNEIKARLIVWISGLLAAITIGLIFMAIVAVGSAA